MRRLSTAPPVARGLTLVELLVGLALGLFVIAVAATLLASQGREQRRLAVEHRLMQDLRTASDVIARDLRRAGHWGDAASAPAANPYAPIAPSAAASDAITFRYSRDAVENGIVDPNEQFGLRLRNGVVELLLGGAWQALTDGGTLFVTEFRIAPVVHELNLADHCVDCLAPGCEPRQQVRSIDLVLSAHAAADAAVRRSLHSTVRLRNDLVSGACPG